MSGLIKPGRWSVNPADIDPRHLNLWNGLVSLVPMWNSSSPTPTDLVWRKATGVPAGGPIAETTRFGPSVKFTPFDEWVEWDTGTSPFAGLFDMSVMLLIRDDDITRDTSVIRKNGTFNFQTVGTIGAIRWAIWPGGSSDLDTPNTPDMVQGQWYMYILTWNEGSGERWTHQWDYTAQLLSSDLDTITANQGALGESATAYRWGATESDNEELDGAIAFFAAWDRVIDLTEVQRLVREPFGWITPYEDNQTSEVQAFFDITNMPTDLNNVDEAVLQVRAQATDVVLDRSYLALDGIDDFAQTSDKPALDITGDLEIIALVEQDDWNNGLSDDIIIKWDGAGNQRSYRFYLNGSGKPSFRWSTNGTTDNLQSPGSAPALTDGRPTWFRVTMDVDDGASDADVTTYWSEDPIDTPPDKVNWTLISTGSPGAVTNIHPGTAPVKVGGDVGDFNGKLYGVWLSDGFGFTPYVYFDGTGDLLTTADKAGLDITNDIDMIGLVSSNSWVSSDAQMIQAKDNGAGNRSWRFSVLAAGTLNIAWSADGTAVNSRSTTDSVDTLVDDGVPIWLRVTMDVDNGASDVDIVFYYSLQPVTTALADIVWVQWDTAAFGSTTSIQNNAGTMQIGSRTTSANDPWNGRIYGTWTRDGIDGTLIADPDFRDTVQGDWSSPPQSDDAGNSWTFTNAVWKRGLVAAPDFRIKDHQEFMYLDGTGDWVKTGDKAVLDITADIEVIVCVSADAWDGADSIITKYASGGDERSWRLTTTGTGEIAWRWSTDGTTAGATSETTNETVYAAAGIKDGDPLWIRASFDVDTGATNYAVNLYWSTDPPETAPEDVIWTLFAGSPETGAAATSIHSGTADVVIGAEDDGSGPWAGRIYGAWVSDELGVPMPHVHFDGTGDAVQTIDKSILDIVGDLEIITLVSPDEIGAGASEQDLVNKWDDAGGSNERSWRLGINGAASDNIFLKWSEDGTAVKTEQSSTPPSWAVGDHLWLRATLDISSGDVIFYTSTDPIDTDVDDVVWTQLGTTQTGTATSIHSGTGIPTLGIKNTEGGGNPFEGRIYGAWVHDGITGPSLHFYIDGVTASSYLSTVDKAQLDITGDIETVALVALDDWTSGAEQVFLSKSTTSQISYWMSKHTNDGLRLKWSTNGTDNPGEQSSITIQAATGVSNGEHLWLRCTLEVASLYRVKFFYSKQPIDTDITDIIWIQFANTEEGSGATSIHSGTAELRLGMRQASGGGDELVGKLYGAWVYDGIGGTQVANPDFRNTDQGNWKSSPQSDDEGNSWIINGSAIWNRGRVADPDFRTKDHQEFVYLDGVDQSVSTTDKTSLDVAGDIELISCFSVENFDFFWGVINKLDATAGYRLGIETTGAFNLRWGNGGSQLDETSDNGVIPLNTPIWVRVTLDVNNGASGYDWAFYRSFDSPATPVASVTWEAIGSGTGGATTTIANAGSSLQLGRRDGTFYTPGRFYLAHIWDGFGGTLVADPDFRTTDTTIDPAGNSWTKNNGAVWGRWPDKTGINVWEFVADAVRHTGAVADPDFRVKDHSEFVWFDGTGDYVESPGPGTITGDIEVIICQKFDDVTAVWEGMIAKGDTNSLGGEWTLERSTGTSGLSWSWRNGADSFLSVNSAVGIAAEFPRWYRVTLDVDDGSSNRVTTFYYSDDPIDTPVDDVAWTEHDQDITAGTTSIFNGTNTIRLGLNESTSETLGRIYGAWVYDGIGGQRIANPDFRIEDMHLDDHGNIWTKTNAVWGRWPDQIADNNVWELVADAVWGQWPDDVGNTYDFLDEAHWVGAGKPQFLYAQLFESDELTSLSDEVLAASIEDNEGWKEYDVSFTGVNTSATKATWDTARVRFRWGVS